jgi:ectoine hydroxylase-related dioxygenase (phytanoyl-CoA dioxygenase family)
MTAVDPTQHNALDGARLSADQIDQFWRDGYLVVDNAVTPAQLASLRATFDGWIDESRAHSQGYGETVDGRPRFDLERDHSAEQPALRRVNSPAEVSDAYGEAMRASDMTECVADLIGPNVKFHHSKINSKLPGARTEVKYHQDFPFTPHSNDDLVTALLMIDEVTLDNGPLEVVPGSHRGPIHEIWQDGVFTGAVAPEVERESAAAAVKCTGPAGAVCLMHTRLLHGSAPNRSDAPRTLFICVYSADDAVPLTPNPVPSSMEGELVCGQSTGRIRSTANEVARPELPKQASFFFQQERS